MAKLVFVDNQSNAAGWAWDDAATFVSNDDGSVGIWSLDGSGANVENDRLHAEADVVITGGVIQPKEFQITQGRGSSKMPYASPIIRREDVKKWSITHYQAGAKATTDDGTANTISNTNNSAQFGLKIIQKAAPVNYEEFLNPTNDHYSRTGQVHDFFYTSDASATAAEICQGLVDAINNDANAPCTAVLENTSDIEITAKNYGDTLTIIDYNTVDSDYTLLTWGSGSVIETITPTIGVGNGWQAVAAEKQFEGYKLGMHNKIHLPKTPDRYASSTGQYDIMTIEVDRHGQDGAPGNDSLIIEMWIPDGWTTTGVLDHQFAGGGNGAAAAHGTSAGATVVLYQRMG